MLAGIGPRAKAAAPALIETLKDKDFSLRCSAVTALGELGPDGGGTIPHLVAALKDEDPFVRICAAETLAKVAPKKRPAAIDTLVDAIRGEKHGSYIPLRAAFALRKLDPNHPAVVPALIRAAKNTDHIFSQERLSALKTLTSMGPQARAALPDLADIVKGQKGEDGDELGFARLEAVKALNRIGLKKSAVPALVKSLKDQSSFFGCPYPGAEVRREAVLALGRLRSEAQTAVPALTEALLDESKPVRAAAAKALRQIQGGE